MLGYRNAHSNKIEYLVDVSEGEAGALECPAAEGRAAGRRLETLLQQLSGHTNKPIKHFINIVYLPNT